MGSRVDSRIKRDSRRRKSFSFERFNRLKSVRDDLLVLKSIWFTRAKGDDHAARLEHFYGPQAKAYDKFRTNFLWGRKPMLAACAARLATQQDLIWVDLGGGTGENVEMMFKYLPMEKFKAVYVVDLCHSLCEVAETRVKTNGWTNVHVFEADACRFQPPEGVADLVTFSYSLTMIPPFHDVIDKAISYLAPEGYVGVTDFFVSSRYDSPLRQMSWIRRFFWRATFDTDNIDIGPERRAYLDRKLERVWEFNSQGSIPYVPYLRAPFFAWLGGLPKPHGAELVAKYDINPSPCGTFFHAQSLIDEEPDLQAMNLNSADVCLTVTGGGCNALSMLLAAPAMVVSVDSNAPQSALLELKARAIKHLSFEDMWMLFGEGKHPQARSVFETKLAPFLSQPASLYWARRLHYFERGLYFYGALGWICWLFTRLPLLRIRVVLLTTASTLEEQQQRWKSLAIVRLVKHAPKWFLWLVIKVISFLFLNRFALRFLGIPNKQAAVLSSGSNPLAETIARRVDGLMCHSHIRDTNHIVLNLLTGHYLRTSCPTYLTEAGYGQLKDGLIDQLTISTSNLVDELKARKYSKVMLSDHLDGLSATQAKEVVDTLNQQLLPNSIVLWRSVTLSPPYARFFQSAGFAVCCIRSGVQNASDRVNMHSSVWIAKKKD